MVIFWGENKLTLLYKLHTHRLLFIVSKCYFVSVVPWRDLLKYLQKCEGYIHIYSEGYIHIYSVSLLWYTVYMYMYMYVNRDIGPAVRVFANGPGDLGSIPGRVIPKTLKMELDTTLLNTQHYKVRFKGKVEQSREWSSALPYTLV